MRWSCDRFRAIAWAGMRRFAILGLVASALLGLASRKLPPTGNAAWDKSFGDADYAVMIGFLLLALRPKLSPRAIGLGAFGICFALELFQLTGIPLRTPRPLRFLLGTALTSGTTWLVMRSARQPFAAIRVHTSANESPPRRELHGYLTGSHGHHPDSLNPQTPDEPEGPPSPIQLVRPARLA